MLRAFVVGFYKVCKAFPGLIDALLYSCQLEGSFYDFL